MHVGCPVSVCVAIFLQRIEADEICRHSMATLCKMEGCSLSHCRSSSSTISTSSTIWRAPGVWCFRQPLAVIKLRVRDTSKHSTNLGVPPLLNKHQPNEQHHDTPTQHAVIVYIILPSSSSNYITSSLCTRNCYA